MKYLIGALCAIVLSACGKTAIDSPDKQTEQPVDWTVEYGGTGIPIGIPDTLRSIPRYGWGINSVGEFSEEQSESVTQLISHERHYAEAGRLLGDKK